MVIEHVEGSAMRIVKAICGVLVAAIMFGPLAGRAMAGGNWIEWRRRYNVAGSVVVARNIFYARSEAKVRQAGPYYAYLTLETNGWQLPDVGKPGTIRLGKVKVIWPGPDSQFKGFLRFNPRARIRFTVPDIPSGDYLIVFCNLGCTRTLGDVDPTGGFSVVHSDLEGRLTQRLDDLRTRFRDSRFRARNAIARVERRLTADLVELRGEATSANQKIEVLNEQLSALKRDAADDDGLPPWGPIVVAGLIFAVTGFLLGSLRRRRRQRELLDVELRRITDEETAPLSQLQR
jgi:hypothetical protein